MRFDAKKMTGRCLSGAGRDRGRLAHAVLTETDPWFPALCGAQPGRRRGNGWSTYHRDVVTCPRCAKLLLARSDIFEATGSVDLADELRRMVPKRLGGTSKLGG
jgi:hypothetical protein